MKFRSIFCLAALIAALSMCVPVSAQIFYEISGNGLEKPSYLFGTHHMAPLSITEKYGLDQYIDQVSQVVGEIDLTQDQVAMALAMQPFMMAPADSTLSKVLSPEDYEVVNELFKKYAPIPGIDLRVFDAMKPMVVSTTISVGIMGEQMPDYDAQNQLDTYLLKKGAEQDKKVVALETPAFQAEVLFGASPIAVQAEALVDMAKNPEELTDNTVRLNEAYMNGDLETMAKISQEDDEAEAEFMEALLDRRNADWLTKLPDILQDGPSFIAVGALHLAGDKGIVEGLRNLGYTVTPVVAQ